MDYMLLIYSREADFAAQPPSQMQEMIGAYRAYTEALQKAEVLRGVNRLRSAATATTVRVNSGKTEVLNGPFAETREQLGGYYLIDAPDLDSALAWAARCPASTYGRVEVRPVWPMTEY